MGFGGNLIWTSVFAAAANNGQHATACDTPMLTDLIFGRLWRGDRSYANDIIFKDNPTIQQIVPVQKNAITHAVDFLFEKTISPDLVRRRYENWVFRRSIKAFHEKQGPLLVHIDMRIHSYAASQSKTNTVWKTGGHAAQIIGKPFGIKVDVPKCHLYFDVREQQKIDELISEYGLHKSFIILEPETNQDWFGKLRAWPEERWQEIVNWLQEAYPDHQRIQVGVGNAEPLEGVIDLKNKTSFREAALLMKRSALFIGTEGGLMHAASAVDVPALILWGGITLPEFAGYADQQKILCHYVDCAPCGNLGWCNNGHKCMRSLKTSEVQKAITSLLGRT